MGTNNLCICFIIGTLDESITKHTIRFKFYKHKIIPCSVILNVEKLCEVIGAAEAKMGISMDTYSQQWINLSGWLFIKINW